MQKKLIHLLIMLLFILPNTTYGQIVASSYRTSDKEDSSRFVIDLSGKPSYKIFSLQEPDRIVIDIKDTKMEKSKVIHDDAKYINEIRYNNNIDDSLRIVLSALSPMKNYKAFILEPSKQSPSYRLVVDVFKGEGSYIPTPVTKNGEDITIPVPVLKERKLPVIVIDAGHGGHDPGAIGHRGTREKDLTLAYARELSDELLATKKYTVKMTRDSDIFIPLKDRVKIAQDYGANIFISIHANSHKNKQADGLSVYTLSEQASDKEAEDLAQEENKADIIDGISFNEAEEVSEVLIDLVQRDTKNLSADFAELIVDETKYETRLLRKPHRFAGFRVLTGPDIPSVLIEIGFLTNRDEERLLSTYNHRRRLAKAFTQAIDKHFDKYTVE